VNTDLKRLDRAARAAVLVAALAPAALASGCAWRGANAPAGGDATQTQTPGASPSPAQTLQTANAEATPRARSPLPPPTGFVNDFANVIDDEAQASLEARLGRLKRRAKIEFAIVTVETTGGQDIFDYSLAVARGWGVGPPAGEEGGGLLLLLSVKDRKWRLQISRSLEGDLPDETRGDIGGGWTRPLRGGRYGEAFNVFVDDTVKRLAERRGFSTKDDELLSKASPKEKSKAAKK
jgi:uncharacterized membrane protein YgcG